MTPLPEKLNIHAQKKINLEKIIKEKMNKSRLEKLKFVHNFL